MLAVGDQGLGGQGDLIDRRAGALDDFDAAIAQILLGVGNGGGGGVLPDVVEEADFFRLRVLGKNQVHNGGGIEIVGRAGNVAARGIQASNEVDGHGV